MVILRPACELKAFHERGHGVPVCRAETMRMYEQCLSVHDRLTMWQIGPRQLSPPNTRPSPYARVFALKPFLIILLLGEIQFWTISLLFWIAQICRRPPKSWHTWREGNRKRHQFEMFKPFKPRGILRGPRGDEHLDFLGCFSTFLDYFSSAFEWLVLKQTPGGAPGAKRIVWERVKQMDHCEVEEKWGRKSFAFFEPDMVLDSVSCFQFLAKTSFFKKTQASNLHSRFKTDGHLNRHLIFTNFWDRPVLLFMKFNH